MEWYITEPLRHSKMGTRFSRNAIGASGHIRRALKYRASRIARMGRRWAQMLPAGGGTGALMWAVLDIVGVFDRVLGTNRKSGEHELATCRAGGQLAAEYAGMMQT